MTPSRSRRIMKLNRMRQLAKIGRSPQDQEEKQCMIDGAIADGLLPKGKASQKLIRAMMKAPVDAVRHKLSQWYEERDEAMKAKTINESPIPKESV